LCASRFYFVGKDSPPWFTKFEFEKFFSLFYIISTQRSYIYKKQIAVLRNWEQFQICSVFFYTPCITALTLPQPRSQALPSRWGKTLAGAGHVSHGNLIAQGGVGKVSNYMLPLSHFTLLLQGVSVLYRSSLRIIYTSKYLPNLICVCF
jgi:hypothetical protein